MFQVLLPWFDAGAFTQEARADLPAGGCERILMIDDELAIAELGAEMLGELGYRVAAYTDSVAALEAFRRDPEGFDLVVTDQTMPRLTGTDLIRHCRELRPDLPVLLCTGHNSPQFAAADAGATEVLLKPVARREFAAAIRRALSGRRREGGHGSPARVAEARGDLRTVG